MPAMKRGMEVSFNFGLAMSWCFKPGVRIWQGMMALARIPSLAYSMANSLVIS